MYFVDEYNSYNEIIRKNVLYIDALDVENKFTKQLPQYIRQYRDFFKFIKMLSNYILSSTETVESDDWNRNIFNYINIGNSTGDLLVKIAKKVNVSYDRAYTDNREQDLKEYYTNLKTGIYGVQSKRLSNGGLYELKDTLIRLFPNIDKIEIKDNMDMTVDLVIYGDIEGVDSSTIENYIIPKVTGVKFNVIYVYYGKNIFAYDKNEFLRRIDDKPDSEFIRAKDLNGNDTQYFVLFKRDESSGELLPILDLTSQYYYNNQRVKVGNYGVAGWDLGSWAPLTSI